MGDRYIGVVQLVSVFNVKWFLAVLKDAGDKYLEWYCEKAMKLRCL